LGHTEDLKNGTCDLSSLVLGVAGGLTTRAAFTAKAAAWLIKQASGVDRRLPIVILQREYKKRVKHNETELNRRVYTVFMERRLHDY